MIDPTTWEEILNHLSKMSNDQQQKVLEYVRSLVPGSTTGTSGKSLLRFAGAINPDDLKTIEQVIQEECEKIDSSSW